MSTEFFNSISAFWTIFSFSFLVALTGAMSPGPLLTYTIIQSMQTRKKGYLLGFWIIIGHAIIEIAIITVLLFGFSFILSNNIVVKLIGVVGGIFLIFFGFSIVRDVFKGKIPTDFLNSEPDRLSESSKKKWTNHPIIGGIIVSMSNPYWWIWWATIGVAFMIQFDVSFNNLSKLTAFFLGHEAGDLIWYVFVSFAAYFGVKKMNKKVYYSILSACGVVMIAFGIFLGVSPLLQK
ncbi:MAG: LysE family transporter [Desulfobacterales bacterium]|nr:LysE family transporter [Desulfobacterales bacterium]